MLHVTLVYAADPCKFLLNQQVGLNGESASSIADELLFFLVFITPVTSQNR
jgi:hypothetical protein